MKKFTFSLEKIQHFKDQLFDIEKNQLGVLNTEKNRLINEQEMVGIQKNELKMKFQTMMQQGCTGLDLMSHDCLAQSIDLVLKELFNKIKEIDRQIELQKQKVLILHQEIKGYEKLRENQMAEYTALELKSEEKYIEEAYAYKTAMLS